MKRYTFKLVIEEGNDKFWEDINKRNVTGCEEAKALIGDALFSVGIDPAYEFSNDQLTLVKYEEDADV